MGDPRAERTRSSTLDAAFQLLGDEGVQGATVERIAECAGVHKTTVYRHWPERVALLAEALETHLEAPPAPDTGSLRGDLIAAMSGLATTISTPPWSVLLPSLIAAAATDDRLAELHGVFTRRRRDMTINVIDRGQRRGQLPAAVDASHLIDALAGAIIYRRLMTHEPIDSSYVEHHVDRMLDAFSQADRDR